MTKLAKAEARYKKAKEKHERASKKHWQLLGWGTSSEIYKAGRAVSRAREELRRAAQAYNKLLEVAGDSGG